MLERGELEERKSSHTQSPFQYSSAAILNREKEEMENKEMRAKEGKQDMESFRARVREGYPSLDKVGVSLGLSKDDVIERMKARIEELENSIERPHVKFNLPQWTNR